MFYLEWTSEIPSVALWVRDLGERQKPEVLMRHSSLGVLVKCSM